jgi:two-component system sensor kinase FixL
MLAEGQINLSISDTADGISDDIKDSVFQLFKSNKASGMGVGLWLSQTVVNSHGGLITFETSEGVGTRFTVHLPL